jgi:hypothetical protein
MTIDLSDIRIRLDQKAEEIISGLKDRSRYPLNEGVFLEEFKDGKTWFEHRLFLDQCADSEFGRYEFDDQHPLLFSRNELTTIHKKRNPPKSDLLGIDIDMFQKILEFYKEIVSRICKPGENPSTYGETAKRDVLNILCLYERICGIGPYVAQSKIQKAPSLLEMEDQKEIQEKLTYLKREEEVMTKGEKIAERYELPNPEVGRDIFRKIIDLTLEVEIKYIEEVRKELMLEKPMEVS